MATERLEFFPSKVTLVPADILYAGDSTNGYSEVQVTLAGLIGAYPNLVALSQLAPVANTFTYYDANLKAIAAPITSVGLNVLASPNTQTLALAVGALPLTGGTMTGSINLGGNFITNAMDPVNPQDLATKKYVDANAGGGGASGTVVSGLANELALYAANGTAVSGLSTANNGVLITSSTGVPQISSTLPGAVLSSIQANASGLWNIAISGQANSALTAGSATTAANLTGLAANSLYGNSGSSTGIGSVISIGSNLSLVNGVLNATMQGSGTVNAGTASQLGFYAVNGSTLSGLTLGTNLSITGSVLNANIPNVGSITNGTIGQLGYYAAAGNVLSGLNIGTNLSINGGTLNAAVYSPTLNQGQIYIGNASNAPTGVTVSGDGTLSNTGVLTVTHATAANTATSATTATTAGSATTAANLTNLAAASLYGNPTNVSAGGSPISLGSNLSFAGSVLNVTIPSVGSVTVGMANQLGYYASNGTALSGLTLGMNLSITAGVLNAATGNPMLTAGDIFVGNAQNSATPVPMSGDATITMTGVVTVSHAAMADNSTFATTAGSATTAANLTALQASSIYGNPSTGVNTGKAITLGVGLFFNGTTLNVSYPNNGNITTGGQNTLGYYGTAGTTLSPLNLGNYLSITSGALNVTLPPVTLASANIFVGNASNLATAVTLTGDASIDNSGKITVSHAAMADSATTATTATSATTATTATTANSANTATTASNLSSLAANTLYGNPTGAVSNGSSVPLGAGLSFVSNALTVTFPPSTGTISSGMANQLGYYSVNGTTLSGLTLGTNLSITSGVLNAATGVPYLSQNYIFVGNASNNAMGVAMSGDATIAWNGTVTVSHAALADNATNATSAMTATSATTAANLSNLPSVSLYGNPTGTAGTGKAVTLGSSLSFSGTTLNVNFPASTGTVNTGAAGTLAYYSAAGMAVSPLNLGAGLSITSGTLNYIPGISTTLNSGQIIVGNASNVATPVTMSGNATISNSGVVTVSQAANANTATTATTAGSATTAANLTGLTALTLYGNPTGSTASGSPITLSAGLSFVGSVLTVTFPPSTGTVNSGTTNALAYYAANGIAVSPLALGAGLSITSGTLNYVPGISTALASGQIIVGNASGVATAVTLSGNATISNTGVITVSQAANALTANTATNANFATTAGSATTAANLTNLTALSLYGNPTSSSSTGSAITLGSNLSFVSGVLTITFPPSTGTVNSGTTNALAYYAANGIAVSPLALGSGLSITSGTLNYVPGISTALASGQIIVGNASGVATAVALSGNATISNSGVITVTQAANANTANSATTATSATTAANLTGLAALSLYGNPTSTASATGTSITLGTGLTFTSGVLNATGGTVSAGSTNALAYYTGTGATVTPLAAQSFSTLLSDANGKPFWLLPTVIGSILQAQSAAPQAYTTYALPIGALTANSILFASSTALVGQIAPGNSGVLITSSAGVPSISTTLPAVTLTANSTGTAATAGTLGELQKLNIKYASAVPYTTSGAIVSLGTITLNPGDWDVWGNITITVGGGSIIQALAAISTSSTSFPDNSLFTQMYSGNGNGSTGLTIPQQPILVTNTTTFYLIYQIVFNTAPTSLTVCGNQYGRRPR